MGLTNRILVVEDDAITREILAQLLQMAGYEVLSAGTGERALLLLREWRGKIHWLFTAVALPGLVDGWIVGDEFCLGHPSRRVVYACSDEAHLSRQDVASVCVRKPIAPLEVLALFKELAAPLETATMPPSVEPVPAAAAAAAA